MIACIFLAVVAVVATLSFLAEKKYIAVAAVVVDIGNDPVAGGVNPSQELPSYIATQLDVVSSDRVAQRVVELLDLDHDPQALAKWQRATHGSGQLKEWAARVLLDNLVVTPSRDSNVINIGYRAADPARAAQYANGFAQAYIDTNIQLKVQPAEKYSAWFEERVKALRADVEAKQKLLYDYQRENGIVPTDDRVNIEATRLAELSTQLANAQSQSRDAQSNLHQALTEGEAMPEVLQSPVIVNLKAQLGGEESKLEGMRNLLGESNPELLRQQGIVEDLRARLSRETAHIIRSLMATANASRQREQETQAALEAQKRHLLSIKRGQDAESLLEQDVLTAQKNLEAVTQRLAQTSLESQTKQSNVVLLSAATEPTRPSSPNIRLNVLLSAFLGALLAIGSALGLEEWDGRVRTGDELPQLLGVPLIGTLSSRPFRRRIGLETI